VVIQDNDFISRDDGLGVVVTGGGHGIGKALARKLAAEGARVVVNDLDAEATRAVAAEIHGLAWPGDAATTSGVAELIGAARSRLGEIDIYFANAGVDVSAGLDATDEQWARSLEVNLMAHVRAARLLVPAWLARGSGRFVVTASAAGLLTALQTAPYAASKHASVGFAEWLSITYANHGVVVQAVCPEGVRTNMVAQASPAAISLVRDRLMEPEDVATAIWEGIQDDRFFILPHPVIADYYRAKADDHESWMRMMRKIQRKLDAAPA
jgi:NAD(P)-dependent dehydrogenase (short-subunit alcohol dehydrogenase family)